ncbi:HNH endonuclease signature motif containing protein [Arthrobacter sp. D5-1]|uniref:HNH endonuclease signature motif containing protein n=1 Tax=Arthrobacter sp. D5-1 TaxID=1477518 RepID=UPI001A988640|nr:HNH endonuclease signature motif containing protein [Arthrobacter sp. D5-1]QSZ48035.1 HNH endonuclease [Arthrobacter sp. D5-1]
MGAIGQVLARRAGSPRGHALLRQRALTSLNGPARVPAFKLTTAVGQDADTSSGTGLLLGLSPMARSSESGYAGGLSSAEVAPGLRVVPVADIKRAAGFVDAGQPSPDVVDVPLAQAGAILTSLRQSVIPKTRLFGFEEAADFAGKVEEIARSVEYLQVVAAQAVERTRTEAQQTKPGPSAAAPQWRTGWTEPATDATAPGVTVPEATDPGVTVPGAASVLDDGYRNAAQFLRARLRIGIGEAKRRLALAPDVLPQTGITGQDIPARHAILAQAVGSALVPSRSASIISTALDKVRHLTDEDTLTRMEHALTTTAVETDPDFVTTMAKRWIDAIDHDGPEPTEEILRQLQGVFLRRRRRHGLHHLEIFATDEQYEILATAMNVATNPRLTTPGTGTTENTETGDTPHNNPHNNPHNGPGTGTSPDLDRRSRPQKLLNGLTSACSLAMRTEKLPANGGLPPQLTVTIGYQELLEQVHNHHHNPGTGTAPNQHGTRTGTRIGTGAGLGTGAGAAPVAGIGTGAGVGTGTATFTGPMHPNTIRKIACDADILPVVLGSDSRILDIGRTTRIFPPHIRKAITARDQGCAFPDCTMPAPWCEAHHTTYWSHGGTTSTDNGTLLCSHHHHLIHKEQWRIDIKTGIPWFIPPPHIDPHQTPRRNHHHTPHRT